MREYRLNVDKLSQVFETLDNLQDCNHSVIFYEEAVFARIVEYYYIKIGLNRGESCIYATLEDKREIIESEMADFGIDVEGSKKAKLLHIYRVSDPQFDPDGLLDGLENIRKMITSESRPPLRIVGRFIKNFAG